MGVIKIITFRIIPTFILAIAIFFGWLSRHELPEGRFFATIFPLMKGYLPPTIIGHGYMKGTIEVPDDMTPRPRPKNEMFLTLPGNIKMPQNGLGMCCRPTAYDDELVRRTVLWYLLLGGRLIDTAHVYMNHKAIGEGIKEAIERGIPRKEIFVTTKIFPRNYGRNGTAKAVDLFLDELGLEYIDLILMHMPKGFFPPAECKEAGFDDQMCREETWRGLSEARQKGLVKNVGVSNFKIEQIQSLNEMNLAPVAVNQMQYNLWSPDFAIEIFEYCQKNNVAVTAHTSLAGFFQNSLTETVQKLTEISEKYERSTHQIMLRWAMQKNAAVIPGTGNHHHMEENLSIYDFTLSKSDMIALDALRADEIAKEFMYFDPNEF